MASVKELEKVWGFCFIGGVDFFPLVDSHFLSDVVLNILKESDMLPKLYWRSLKFFPCL